MAAFVRAGIPEHYVGLSTDVKPTGVPVNSRAYETDTGAEYLWNGTAWVAYAPTSYQGATVFSGHITFAADNQYDVGSPGASARSIYVDTIVYATSVAGNWSPSANNTYDLGTILLGWKDGYFTGKLFVGDTLNANMTVGLTINQGAASNQAFCVKASGVATGLGNATAAILVTSCETDDYFSMAPWSASLGGACMMALGEDNVGLTRVMVFGAVGGRADTTKTTAGVGLVSFTVSQHDGANALSDIAADGNIFSIRARVGAAVVTRWLLDEDGDTWQTGDITLGTSGAGLLTAPSNGAEAYFKAWDNDNSVYRVLMSLISANNPYIALGTGNQNLFRADGTILFGKPVVWGTSADSAAVADEVSIGCYEISAGHRALAISSEEVVVAEVDETKFSHKLPVRINGATYNLMLCAT